MKHIKIRNIMVGLFIVFIGFQFNLLFQITETSASTYNPTNSDYAMSVSVDLSNISIYEVNNGNTTTANVTSFNSISNLGPKLIMYLPEAQILSGSSPQAVLFTYNHQNNAVVKPLFINTPIITSFSLQGYSQINYAFARQHTNEPMAKIYSISKTNSLASIEQFSSTMAQRYSIFNLKAVNTNFSQSSFNNRIGLQTTQSLKYTDANAMVANTTAIQNMSLDTFQGKIDPSYYSVYQNFNSTASQGPVPISQFNPNMQQSQKQQTFFAGYTNFEDQAIQTPVKDYAIQALASQGIYLSVSQLLVNYTSMNDIKANTQISGALREHVLAPINQTLANKLGLVNIHLSFLGFNFFNVQRVDAFSFTLPNINVASFATGAANAIVNSPSEALNLATSGFNGAKSFVEDDAGPTFNSLLHNPLTTDVLCPACGVASAVVNSKPVSSFTQSVLKGASHLVHGGLNLGSITNMFNPTSWAGSIFSTIVSFIKPYIPFILLGIGIIAFAVIAYFIIYQRIIAGILFKK